MKLKESEEICDRCKDRVSKHNCLGCGCALCPGCSYILRMHIFTMDYEEPQPKSSPASLRFNYSGMFTRDKTNVAVTDWALCKKCKNGINKKDALEEIQKSDEMKAFMDKVRKTTLASRMLASIDKSEVKEEVDGTITPPSPTSYASSLVNPVYKKAWGGFWKK